MLPSSHCSVPVRTKPSPQVAASQVLRHASVLTVFMSSHVSTPVRMKPSPQVAATQVVRHASELLALPSSHGSMPARTKPSPQLAAAQVLWSEGLLPRTQVVRFHTLSGVLTATAQAGRIVLDFPTVAMTPCAPPEGLIGALGVQPLAVWRAGPDLVIEAHDAATVEDTRPDLTALAAIPCRGVAVTAAGQGDVHVVSRFFAPAFGIPEDAVTGSLHCALGPYWSRRLRQPVLRCRQASARGGMLEVEPRGERVLLGGTAVVVMAGRLLHPA